MSGRDEPSLPQVPFARLLDHSSDAFVAHDFLGRRIYSNSTYDQMVGYDGSVLIGRWGPFPDWEASTEKAISAGLRATWSAQRNGSATPEPIITSLRHVSGQSAPVGVELDVLADARGNPMVGLALVRPLKRLPWLERRHSPDTDRVRALEEVIQSIAVSLSKVGVSPVSQSGPPPQHPVELGQLSAREWQVFQQILAGRRVPSVAERLHLSQHTVRNHLKAIFRKLEVNSQAALVERYRPLVAYSPTPESPRKP